ncbi:MAG: hypothetical protein ACLTYB_13810 [Clostridium paraputrificum]
MYEVGEETYEIHIEAEFHVTNEKLVLYVIMSLIHILQDINLRMLQIVKMLTHLKKEEI